MDAFGHCDCARGFRKLSAVLQRRRHIERSGTAGFDSVRARPHQCENTYPTVASSEPRFVEPGAARAEFEMIKCIAVRITHHEAHENHEGKTIKVIYSELRVLRALRGENNAIRITF